MEPDLWLCFKRERTMIKMNDVDYIEEVKSCVEYVKDFCKNQGRTCKGCVLFDAEEKVCKVCGLPKDWGYIE